MAFEETLFEVARIATYLLTLGVVVYILYAFQKWALDDSIEA